VLGLGDMTSGELCILAVTSPGLRDRIGAELAKRVGAPRAPENAAGARTGAGGRVERPRTRLACDRR